MDVSGLSETREGTFWLWPDLITGKIEICAQYLTAVSNNSI
jgi:hypothetical protein